MSQYIITDAYKALLDTAEYKAFTQRMADCYETDDDDYYLTLIDERSELEGKAGYMQYCGWIRDEIMGQVCNSWEPVVFHHHTVEIILQECRRWLRVNIRNLGPEPRNPYFLKYTYEEEMYAYEKVYARAVRQYKVMCAIYRQGNGFGIV